MFLYSLSGIIPKKHKWRHMSGEHEKALDSCADPKQLPAWLKPEDLDYYAEEYSRTGFRGGLNWYRGQDIFWQQTPFLIGRKLLQPTLYVGRLDDAVVEFARPMFTTWRRVPHLWKKVLLPGVGHWTEQEAPSEVNRLMVQRELHLRAFFLLANHAFAAPAGAARGWRCGNHTAGTGRPRDPPPHARRYRERPGSGAPVRTVAPAR